MSERTADKMVVIPFVEKDGDVSQRLEIPCQLLNEQ